MINIANSSNFNIFLPNTNRALSLVLKDLTAQELDTISQGKDLKSIINGMLKQSLNNNSANNELLKLIKNNPTLKNLGNVSCSIKNLLNIIKSDAESLPIKKVLNSFLIDIKDIKDINIKQKFENSGIFLESKLKYSKNQNNLQEILTNDLKATLLKTTQELTKISNPNQTQLLKHIDTLLVLG